MTGAEQMRNAMIKRVDVSIDDRGCLTMWVSLEYGGWGQSFGGRVLYLPKSFRAHCEISNHAGHFIYRCMEVAGVTNLKDMVGKAIRIRATPECVIAIGHITDEDWFCWRDDFEAIEREHGGARSGGKP